MKAVQIGGAGHAGYANKGIKEYGIELAALACGSAGIEAEGTKGTLDGFIRRGHSPKLYENWREMLDTEKPDIAIINPPFWEIADCAAYALERGIHVFAEKPLAQELSQLEMLEAAYRRSDAKLAGMFGTRNEAAFLTAKKAIADGRIGKVRMMDSRKSYKCGTRPEFYKSRKTYPGIIPWVAIHAIDWMQWLSGESYTAVSAFHSCLENRDNGEMDITSSAQFMMTNEVIATVTADMYRPGSAATHGDDRVRIVGTAGILEVMGGEVSLISDAEGGKIMLPLEPAGDIFVDFLEQILHGKESELTAENAFEVTRWALIARDDAEKRSGGRV
ncbi:MAG: Gfo/Idh/MocA family oxidoreductase [Ruminococcaceae bacterium]|nr:Gfo/Idh/MocA family oxidoreductase [Oscillospiraceae bacterium]